MTRSARTSPGCSTSCPATRSRRSSSGCSSPRCTCARALLKRINAEAENARTGVPAGIRIKVNSIVDEAIIDALYRASQAGVPIDLLVRGICALRPGVAGAEREHPGALDPRPLPRALADLLVRERRRPAGVHRQRRPDAPQPRPPGRGARAARQPRTTCVSSTTCSTSPCRTTPHRGGWTRSGELDPAHSRPTDGTPLGDMQNVLMRQISARKRTGVFGEDAAPQRLLSPQGPSAGASRTESCASCSCTGRRTRTSPCRRARSTPARRRRRPRCARSRRRPGCASPSARRSARSSTRCRTVARKVVHYWAAEVDDDDARGIHVPAPTTRSPRWSG